MKKEFFFIIIIISLIACNSQKSNIYNEISVQSFKDRTLEKCLQLGYEDKNLINKINNIDRSIYNPIATALYDEKIYSILTPVIKKMKIDSTNSMQKVSEAKAGKNVFSSCIKYYNSKELNNIARKEYKKIMTIKNIDSIINEHNPSF